MHGNIVAALPPVGGRPPGSLGRCAAKQRGLARPPLGNGPRGSRVWAPSGCGGGFLFGRVRVLANGGAAWLRQKWCVYCEFAHGEAAWPRQVWCVGTVLGNGGAGWLRQNGCMAHKPADGEAAWLCARWKVRPTVQDGDDCQRREKPPPFLTAGKSRALRGRINMAKRRQPTLPRMIARPRRQKRAKRGFSRSGPSLFSAYSFRKE